MNASLDPSHDRDARPEAQGIHTDLPPRARTVGVVVWCSFLAAAAATMVVFAFLDPAGLSHDKMPSWWTSRRAVYAVGFFFLWAVAAGAAALTIYMAHTEPHDADTKA